MTHRVPSGQDSEPPPQSPGQLLESSPPVQQPSPQTSAGQSLGHEHLVSPGSQKALLQPTQAAFGAHWNSGAQPGWGATRVCRIEVAPLQPPALQPTLVHAP